MDEEADRDDAQYRQQPADSPVSIGCEFVDERRSPFRVRVTDPPDAEF
jgi:hypothetical protein